MTRHKRTSIFITTIFGFIYVMANAGTLPSTAATAAKAPYRAPTFAERLILRADRGRTNPSRGWRS